MSTYTKNVRSRVHKYIHSNPDKIVWRKEIASECGLTEEQVRDACAVLARERFIVVIERAQAWQYLKTESTGEPSEPFKPKENALARYAKTYAEMNAVSAYPAKLPPVAAAKGETMHVIVELGEKRVLLQDDQGGLWSARYVSEA
jgi:hypothetical protein